MAHWAQIDENGVVLQVLVGDNDAPDEGYGWCVANYGGKWLKTSYNTIGNEHAEGGAPFRGNYASEGMIYREDLDAFIFPQPYPSWLLNEATFLWEAPVPQPSEKDNAWAWDENIVDWVPLEADPS